MKMIFDKNKFRELREARGLTLSQVANACNVSQSMVSRWEKEGKSCPLPAKIQKLAAILQCEASDLAIHGKSKDEQGINELLIGIANTLDRISETLKRIEEGGIK